MNKIAFLSFVFPSIEKYLDDFFVSLERQTIRGFDLYIINDGLKDFDNYKKKYSGLNIIEINYVNSNKVKVREFGINFVLKKRYKFIVLGDADDYFAENRVECTVSYLKNNDIVINELNLVDEKKDLIKGQYLSKRIANGHDVSYSFILDKNICGFSNGAIKGELVDRVKFKANLVAVDWFFFSVLLLKRYKAIFTNETITYYRQHSNNLVGIKGLKKNAVFRMAEIKLAHYQALSQYDPKLKTYRDCAKKLVGNLADDGFLCEYYSFIKGKTKNPLWWEEIKINKVI